MIASKVSFSTHTREMLNARPLSRTHKAKLRTQRIVEFIRELPYGECKKADLIMAGGWDMNISSHYANGWSFIERMVKNKIIRMTDGTAPRNSYVKKWEVLADTHIIKPRVQTIEFPTEPADHTVTNDHGKMTWPAADGVVSLTPQLEPVIPQPPFVEEPTDDLLEQAKNFAWNTNSDSLREFVAWVRR